MNKREFLQCLREKLIQMPEEEVKTALRYYEEYFDEAGIQNEARVIEELGSPEQVAKQILAEWGIKEERKMSSEKQGKKIMWLSIGGVLCILVLWSMFNPRLRNNVVATDSSVSSQGKYIDKEGVLASFENMNIEVDMMDVEVKVGKEYKVNIHYLEQDEIIYAVKDNTLTFTQKK